MQRLGQRPLNLPLRLAFSGRSFSLGTWHRRSARVDWHIVRPAHWLSFAPPFPLCPLPPARERPAGERTFVSALAAGRRSWIGPRSICLERWIAGSSGPRSPAMTAPPPILYV